MSSSHRHWCNTFTVSRASSRASRRSVFIRSPGSFGISAGATISTSQPDRKARARPRSRKARLHKPPAGQRRTPHAGLAGDRQGSSRRNESLRDPRPWAWHCLLHHKQPRSRCCPCECPGRHRSACRRLDALVWVRYSMFSPPVAVEPKATLSRYWSRGQNIPSMKSRKRKRYVVTYNHAIQGNQKTCKPFL